MKKNFMVLHVRRHASEIDYIIPLLDQLKKKYNLITIFNNTSAYKSLQNNQALYRIWKKINYSQYIQKKKENLIYKILHKLVSLLILINFKRNFLLKLNFFFLIKIYNFNFLPKIRNIDYSSISLFFLTDNNYSFFPNFLKYKNSRIKIIRYPEATWIREKKQMEQSSVNINLITDYYLVPVKQNLFLYGEKLSKEIKRKIIITGYFKYQKEWINKITQNKIINKSNFNILVATRPFRNFYEGDFSKESYEYLVDSIMQISNKIKNSSVTFKVHPNHSGKEEIFLLKILSKYTKKKWSIKHDHLYRLATNANICVSFQTSACLDILAAKKGVIEFWLNNIDWRSLIHLKKKKISVFEKYGLVLNINSKKELESLIFKIKDLKKTPYYHKQRINFNKLNKNHISYNKLNKLISA
jgi:hypothetical protein